MGRATFQGCGVAACALVLASCGQGERDDFFGSQTDAGSATDDQTGASLDESGGSSEDGEDEGGVLYDVAGDGGNVLCNCEVEYIWIANSEESTVSKIDVHTLDELARYRTHPDGNGNPSRTSVSLAGDVAVANRHGGLVKFFGDIGKCQDTNGIPGIQTSTASSCGVIPPFLMAACCFCISADPSAVRGIWEAQKMSIMSNTRPARGVSWCAKAVSFAPAANPSNRTPRV